MAEDLVAVAAIGAHVPAHVLDEAEWGHVELAKHLERLDRDVGGDVLGSAHDGDSGERDSLRQSQRCVARARRQVDDQVVELSPVDLDHHGLDRLAHHRAPVDRRLVARIDVTEGHELHTVRFDGEEVAVDLLRNDARPGHGGNRWPVDVGVEQSDAGSTLAQRGGEVHSDS